MFPFVKQNQYTRQQIWKTVKGGDEKMTLNFQQSGYERINEDLSLLCSNCHRMIHRKKKWLTIDELKNIYRRIKT